MPELTLQNIELITSDIRRQDVNYSHLLDELIDHVCCDIENEMENGLSFKEAYKVVKQKIGPGRFREIQKETLYAVDLKYRLMKNTMKISGIAGTIMFGVAALFKIQHWPGASIMMTLGAFILAFIFLPSSLGVLWKETHNRSRLFLFISIFLTGFFFIAGTLFKVQHWPGASIILMVSTVSAVLMFLPSMLITILKNEENKSKRTIYFIAAAGTLFYVLGMLFKIMHWPMASMLILSGISILGFIVLPWYTIITWKDETNVDPKFMFILIACLAIIVPGALINMNLQNDYDQGYYYNQDRQSSLYDYLYKSNTSLLSVNGDSSVLSRSRAIHKETMNLISSVDEIRKLMVRESEKDKPAVSEDMLIIQSDKGLEINYRLLSDPFQFKAVNEFLLPGQARRTELETAIRNYTRTVSSMFPDQKDVSGILDLSLYTPSSESPMSLLAALNSLDLLRNSILSVEAGLLNSLNTVNNNQLNALK